MRTLAFLAATIVLFAGCTSNEGPAVDEEPSESGPTSDPTGPSPPGSNTPNARDEASISGKYTFDLTGYGVNEQAKGTYGGVNCIRMVFSESDKLLNSTFKAEWESSQPGADTLELWIRHLPPGGNVSLIRNIEGESPIKIKDYLNLNVSSNHIVWVGVTPADPGVAYEQKIDFIMEIFSERGGKYEEEGSGCGF